MVNGNANGLALSTLIGALVHGNAKDVAAVDAAHAGTGLKVGREMLENIAADTMAKGYRGSSFVREFLRRTDGWGKYGLEALSIAAAPAIASRLGAIAGNLGLDAKTRGYLEMAFVDLAEGVSRGAIVASDPNRVAKIDALVTQVEKKFDNAFRDHYGVTHLSQLAADGSVIEDSKGRPQACVHWQQMTAGFDAQNPDIIVRNNNGGNNNQNQGRVVVQPGAKIPYVRGSYEVLVAGQSEPHLCPVCLPLRGTAAKPAEKAAAWWPRVDGNAAVKRVLLAVTHKIGKEKKEAYVMVDLLEDLERSCSFEAIKILCEDIDPRLVEVQQVRQETDATGAIVEIPAGSYDEISDADLDHFRNWIDGLGGAELKPITKAKVEALDLKEHIIRVWSGKEEKDADGTKKKHWELFKKGIIIAVIVVLLYVFAWPIATLAVWAVGVFFPDGHLWVNIACAMVSTLSLIVWLTFWYTPEGIKNMFGGFISSEVDAQGNPGLANLARNLTALFVGSSLLALLELCIGTFTGVDSTAWRAFSVPGAMLAAIAYDRTAAAWTGSKKISERRETYAFGTVGQLSAIGLIILVVGALAMAKSWYVGPQKTEAEKAEEAKIAQTEVVKDLTEAITTDAKARQAEADAAKAKAAADAKARAEATAKALADVEAAPRSAPKAEVAPAAKPVAAESDAERCARYARYPYDTRYEKGCVK